MPVGIVTGASRGLGLALARSLDAKGWRLVVDARGAEPLAAATARLDGVVAIPGDVGDAAHRQALVEAAGERIDLLVSNASLLGPSPRPQLAAYPLTELARVYGVNLPPPPRPFPPAPPRPPSRAPRLPRPPDPPVEPY